MLNPDGVVVGNYRCSLAGRDLNRNYKTLLRDSFPCVWNTRNMVERWFITHAWRNKPMVYEGAMTSFYPAFRITLWCLFHCEMPPILKQRNFQIFSFPKIVPLVFAYSILYFGFWIWESWPWFLLHVTLVLFCHTLPRLKAEMDVLLYCDFHGHSRKNNVFMYGCNNRSDASLKLQERVFPLMMSKNAGNKVK